MADRWYYLGPWIWESGSDAQWHAPDDCVACIDLRSIPQMSIAGSSPEGFGLFALDQELIDSDYGLIARSMDDPIGPARRSQISSRLDRQVTQNRLDRMLYELLTLRGDPTGDDFARPIMPTMRRQLEIHLEGEIFRKPWRHDLAEMSAMMHQLREQYRDHRQQVLDGIMPPNHHRRILDFTRKKYRIDWHLLKPDDLPDEEPIPHETSVSDDFNRADEELGVGGWTEVSGDWEVVSNVASLRSDDNSPHSARFDSDLSSDDHFAQVECVTLVSPSVASRAGPACRYASAAETFYEGQMKDVAGTDNILFAKVVAGSRTVLDADVPQTFTIPDTIYCSADGSTMITRFNGAEAHNFTDSSITGNVRTGITGRLHSSAAPGDAEVDDFTAADLAAAVGNPWYHNLQQVAGAA